MCDFGRWSKGGSQARPLRALTPTPLSGEVRIKGPASLVKSAKKMPWVAEPEDEDLKSKRMLVREMRQEFSRWEELLGSLRDEQIVRRDLPGGLSVKDVVAHLMAWQGLSIARLEAAIDNRDPSYRLGPEGLDPDEDENIEKINAWIHGNYLDMPWVEVYGKWSSGFLHFVELAEKIPEEALMQPARFAWLKDTPLAAVVEGSYEHHHDEHYGPLVRELEERGRVDR